MSRHFITHTHTKKNGCKRGKVCSFLCLHNTIKMIDDTDVCHPQILVSASWQQLLAHDHKTFSLGRNKYPTDAYVHVALLNSSHPISRQGCKTQRPDFGSLPSPTGPERPVLSGCSSVETHLPRVRPPPILSLSVKPRLPLPSPHPGGGTDTSAHPHPHHRDPVWRR